MTLDDHFCVVTLRRWQSYGAIQRSQVGARPQAVPARSPEVPARQDLRPLVVDHNYDREIGRVHSLFQVDWMDGPWICARATLTAPPVWPKRGTGASFESISLQRNDWDIHGVKADVIAHAIVKEVSALSTKRPAEPRAEVLTCYRTEPVPGSPELQPGDQVIYGNGQLIRRYFPAVITVR